MGEFACILFDMSHTVILERVVESVIIRSLFGGWFLALAAVQVLIGAVKAILLAGFFNRVEV